MSRIDEIYKKGLKALDDAYSPKKTKNRLRHESDEPAKVYHVITMTKRRDK